MKRTPTPSASRVTMVEPCYSVTMNPTQILQAAILSFILLLDIASSIVSPNLPFGDVNVVVLTDVHSWVGGHGTKEPQQDADYGDILSFFERLKEYSLINGHDTWFVVNGDWIDGTGLATNGDPSKLIPLLEKMPWDALNVGNHELYKKEVITYMTQPGGYVEWWGDRFLTSNIVHTNSMQPMGNPYRMLRGRNSTVLTFAFLYNMKDNDQSVTVKEVESVVKEAWFKEALRGEEYDAILVLAHMGAQDPLLAVILDEIRMQTGSSVPVQFITGHTHKRGYFKNDNVSASFEAGRFLDTVGFCSFPNRATVQAVGSNATNLFKHTFLDANVQVLTDTIGEPKLETENGADLSTFIARVREEMGLEENIGCVEQFYYTNRSLDDEDSLWAFFRDRVMPSQENRNGLALLGKGSWRYDLPAGVVRLDDAIAVSPFNETLYEWKRIPSEIIVALNETLNGGEHLPYLPLLPNYIMASARPFVAVGDFYDVLTDVFEMPRIQEHLTDLFPEAGPAVRLNDTTTSTIWVNFFRHNWLCRKKESTKKPGLHPFGSSNGTTPRITERDPQLDQFRLVFACVAFFAVLLLASVNVRQRGTLYSATVRQREQQTFDALQEYEGDEGQFV